MSTSAEFL